MNYIIFFTLLVLTSCGFLPSGDKVLSKRINNASSPYNENLTESNFDIAQGRPIFIEALTYPQYIDGGHVSLEGKLGVMIGRESIRIHELISLPRSNETLEDEVSELKDKNLK